MLLSKINAAKKELSIAKSVAEWNDIRNRLKSNYSQEVISIIDASGYINSVIKKEIPNER